MKSVNTQGLLEEMRRLMAEAGFEQSVIDSLEARLDPETGTRWQFKVEGNVEEHQLFDVFLEKVTTAKQWVHLQAGSGKTSRQPKETTEVAMTPEFVLALDDAKRSKSLGAVRATSAYQNCLKAGHIPADLLDSVVQATIDRTPLLTPEMRLILMSASADMALSAITELTAGRMGVIKIPMGAGKTKKGVLQKFKIK